MLKLEDGREKLYQWDSNRKVLVGEGITEVHFSNVDTVETITVKVIDGSAAIPEELLQQSYDINCYAIDTNYTRYDVTFEVIARQKPSNYVYVPTWDSKLDKEGWVPNKVMVTDEKGEIVIGDIKVESGVDSVNGKTGVVELGANDITFDDGETFQQKLNNGSLRGQDGVIGRDGAPGKDGKTPIKGVDYFDGKDGKDGAIGPQGPQGLTGPKGDTGAPGIQGPQGIPGKDGKDGVLSFKDLSEAEKATLKGDKGDVGPQGIQGEQGPQGLPGKDGAKGEQGIQGLPGVKGDKGDSGVYIGASPALEDKVWIDPDGLATDGIVSSVNGKTGTVELKANDIAFDDGETFQQKLNKGVLKGADGKDGLPGAKGADGAPGKDGIDGQPGPQGLKGDKGEPGIQGPAGKDGSDATVPIATVDAVGKVKPDGTTITITEDGTISSAGGGGGGFPLEDRIKAGTGRLAVVINEADGNIANGDCSLSAGMYNDVYAHHSFATGSNNTSYGSFNIVSGNFCTVGAKSFKAYYSAGFGQELRVTDSCCLCVGSNTQTTNSSQFVNGRYNIQDGNYARIVGNGNSINELDNAYTLDWLGNGSFKGKVSSQGADYAEYFEWKDGNPSAEDRVGYIVTLDGDKIRLAQAGDDVLGIISGTVGVLGDNYEWNWQGKYLTDKFGRIQVDMVEEFTEHENENGVMEKISLGKFPHPRLNPDYVEDKEYVNRANRPEWDAVGMMGKLYVRDNGTCEVGKYATVDNGIATGTTEKTNMRVINRVDETTVRVVLK